MRILLGIIATFCLFIAGWYYYWYMPEKKIIAQLLLERDSLEKQVQALRVLEGTITRLTDENSNLEQACREYLPVHSGSVVSTLLKACDSTGVRLVRCAFKKSEHTRDIFLYRVTGEWDQICRWWRLLSDQQGIEWGSYDIKMVQDTLMCKGVIYAYTHIGTAQSSGDSTAGDPGTRSL